MSNMLLMFQVGNADVAYLTCQ